MIACDMQVQGVEFGDKGNDTHIYYPHKDTDRLREDLSCASFVDFVYTSSRRQSKAQADEVKERSCN